MMQCKLYKDVLNKMIILKTHSNIVHQHFVESYRTQRALHDVCDGRRSHHCNAKKVYLVYFTHTH